ncbi:MAG TPA: rRNA maturation RNase YbeY [Bacteroidota bacterium]|nr:rRNA maturation RNase YbeY [Bacteroidota bacterium]
MMRITVGNAHPSHRRRSGDVRRLVHSVLRGEHCRAADVGVIFINDRRMRTLNRQYLHHTYTTDVLSFPLSDRTADCLEGEVYVNLDQARRQAAEYHVSFRQEIARLMIHGTLHLLGYDDSTLRLRERMTRRENRYLQRNGYDD